MFKVTFSETYLVSFSECMVSLSFQIAHYLQSQMMLDFGGESECTFLLGKHSSFFVEAEEGSEQSYPSQHTTLLLN